MESLEKFDRYIEHLCAALEHKDRNAGLQDYCRGLMLPIHRKSVEPLAAHTDPLHVAAKHQSLHHFVTVSWQQQGIDLAEFPHFKRWFEELSERPAVQRGLAVTAGEPEDPASVTPEEQERRRKILYNQRARPAPSV
jgi:hypothetical protein